MASLKNELQRVKHRGRTFLFVSYDAEDPSPKQVSGRPPMWFLVSSNNRWPAVPYSPEQPATEVDAMCIAWLEEAVFGPAPVPAPAEPPPPQRFLRPE